MNAQPAIEKSPLTKQPWNAQLSERAGKLSERGAHYFVGWLISEGTDKPEMAEVFEKVLRHMETDPKLRYCWHEDAGQVGEASASAGQPIFSIYREEPGVSNVAAPSSSGEESAQECSASRGTPVQTKCDPLPVFPKGFFARLFRRQGFAA